MSLKKAHSREQLWAELDFSFTCGVTFLWSLAYNTGEISGCGRMKRMFLGSLAPPMDWVSLKWFSFYQRFLSEKLSWASERSPSDSPNQLAASEGSCSCRPSESKVIRLRECAPFPHVGFALSVTCACESFPCCGFGANLQRVCLARLTASPEYSSMCKTSHNAQLLMLFHTFLPPSSRDLMTNSFNFSYPEARHVRKEGAALWKCFYF